MSKRGRADGDSPRTLVLNISGRKFQVARSTLMKMGYFEPILAGRFAIDEDDGIFIDRDPDLFAVILQAVRLNRRPPRQILDRFGVVDVLSEARYFCVDWLSEILSGKLVQSVVPQEVRTTLGEEAIALRLLDEGSVDPEHLLVDLHKIESGRLAPLSLGWGGPLLFDTLSTGSKRREIAGYEEFLFRLDAFAGGKLVECLKELPAVCVVAGGCVMGALLEEPAGDVDIFIVEDPGQARNALEKIYTCLQASHAKKNGVQAKMLITRSRNAVTIYRQAESKPSVQVITSTYKSTANLLLRFDVDCCAIAWEPRAGRVVATKRAIQALRTGVNVADAANETSGYLLRLEKYSRRGFALFLPGLDLSMVRKDILTGSYTFYQDLDVLLRVDERQPGPIEVWGGRMKASSIQRGTVVNHTERLIVMHLGRYKTTSLRTCRLTSAGAFGSYWILRGVRKDDDASDSETEGDAEDDDDESLYRRAPARLVDKIMRESVQMELRKEGYVIEEGGAVPCCCWKTPNIRAVLQAACSKDRRSTKLSFVFDVASGETSFEDLHFIHDAGREPLYFKDDDMEAFEDAYGIPRKLTFSPAQHRRTAEIDWFSAVY